MKGYIIESEDGGFLCRDLRWGLHEKITDAYIHPPYRVEQMKNKILIKKWDCKPVKAHPAMYDEKKGTEILNEPIIDLKISGVKYNWGKQICESCKQEITEDNEPIPGGKKGVCFTCWEADNFTSENPIVIGSRQFWLTKHGLKKNKKIKENSDDLINLAGNNECDTYIKKQEEGDKK